MVTVQLEEELEQLRQSHANITSELEKNKKLLSMQQTISDQYKKEVCQCQWEQNKWLPTFITILGHDD